MQPTITETTHAKPPGRFAALRGRTRVRLRLAGRGLAGVAVELFHHPTALLGGVIVLIYILAAIFAPAIAPHGIDESQLSQRLAPPAGFGGDGYILGGDPVGRDLLSRIIYGARVSIAIGVLTTFFSAVVGVLLGAVAAYYRGPLDAVVSRIADFLLAFPMLIFAIGVMTILGPGFWIIILALTFKSWVEFFRLVRGEMLAEKTKEYVEAARALGQPGWAILLRETLPNVMNPVIVVGTLRMGTFIIAEASLSFLGLGIQPPTPAWGSMVAEGRDYMLDAWWVATFPGLAILILVLSINLLGEGLRDILDPRLKAQ